MADTLEEELEGGGWETVGDLLKERESLKKRLRTSQERLRKLRMVKIHRSKVLLLTLPPLYVFLSHNNIILRICRLV